jgi:UPF0755 protein
MKKNLTGSAEVISIFLTLISLTFLACLVFSLNLLMPVSFEDRWTEVRIPEGVTYTQGINILKKDGIIKNKYIFLLLGRITMTDRKLRAGYYNLNVSMSPWSVFNRLRKGMIVQYTITVPNGSILADIRLKFKNTGLIDDDSWQLVFDRDFLDSLDIDAPSLEGYIYPDTYNFAKGTEPKNIFRIIVHRLREKFNQFLKDRAEELGMSEKEVLTLASIIENEALFNREKPIISAVYHNRLKKKMRLQADPTVTYGTKRRGKRIRWRDLRKATPYNTYVINGLPPGPISSPGIKSIKAALQPADVDYMYFVSKNDGTHHFSRTGEEHEKAVTLYQRRSRTSKARTVSDKEAKPLPEPDTQEPQQTGAGAEPVPNSESAVLPDSTEEVEN